MFPWPDHDLMSFLPYLLTSILSWNSTALLIALYSHSTRCCSSPSRAWPASQAKIGQGQGCASNGQRSQSPGPSPRRSVPNQARCADAITTDHFPHPNWSSWEWHHLPGPWSPNQGPNHDCLAPTMQYLQNQHSVRCRSISPLLAVKSPWILVHGFP